METFLFYLSTITFIFFFIGGIYLIIGYYLIAYLRDTKTDENLDFPKISVIVPAKNEEKNISEATLSKLNQDYPDFEVIVINDRSTDNTSRILSDLEQAHENLKIINIDKLPSGWLGKNNALQKGAAAATGELLLFSDADVIYKPGTLKKSVTYLMRNELDSLSVSPDLKLKGALLKTFISVFFIYLSVYTQPWLAKYRWTSKSIGIGAFILVRRKIYEDIGGHTKIKMRPEDDLKLGELIKKAGGSIELLYGYKQIEVEWYSSMKEVIEGLSKNSFAAVNYSYLLLALGIIGQLVLNVFPFAALFFTQGITQLLYAFSILIVFIIFSGTTKFTGAKNWYCVGFPLMSLMFIYIQLRSMWKVSFGKGLNWRGTYYSLKDLKNNKL